MPNRTPTVLEELILLQTRKNPLVSYIRLAGEIKSEGGRVTPTMVRYVWQRHGLSTQSARRAWVKLLNVHSRLQTTKDLSKEALDRPIQSGSNHDGASVVDWAYWGERVRESLTK